MRNSPAHSLAQRDWMQHLAFVRVRPNGLGMRHDARWDRLKILLATGHPHLPQFTGGSQSSTHELAIELKRHGHDVAVLSGLNNKGWVGLRGRVVIKMGGVGFAHDNGLGYDVYRKWLPWENLGGVVAAFQPDVAILQAIKPVAIAEELDRHGVATVVYFRDVDLASLGGDPRRLSRARFIANSHFTSEFYFAEYGIRSEIIFPMFDAARYTVERTPKNVTFINPVPIKGVDLAIEIAKRCPHIPFRFVESWPLSATDLRDLAVRLEGVSNVELRPRTNDMKSVYKDAKLVIVPSQCEEAWGRIVSEAHFSGIPVLASNVGGLPEAVGAGGLVFDKTATADDWACALKNLFTNEGEYMSVSRRALELSQRPALDPRRQIAALLDVAVKAVASDCAHRDAGMVK